MGLSEKEAALKAKVSELTDAYQRAKAEAEKFNAELEKHGEKADAARAKIADLEKRIDAMPAPVAGAGKEICIFCKDGTYQAVQSQFFFDSTVHIYEVFYCFMDEKTDVH